MCVCVCAMYRRSFLHSVIVAVAAASCCSFFWIAFNLALFFSVFVSWKFQEEFVAGKTYVLIQQHEFYLNWMQQNVNKTGFSSFVLLAACLLACSMLNLLWIRHLASFLFCSFGSALCENCTAYLVFVFPVSPHHQHLFYNCRLFMPSQQRAVCLLISYSSENSQKVHRKHIRCMHKHKQNSPMQKHSGNGRNTAGNLNIENNVFVDAVSNEQWATSGQAGLGNVFNIFLMMFQIIWMFYFITKFDFV